MKTTHRSHRRWKTYLLWWVIPQIWTSTNYRGRPFTDLSEGNEWKASSINWMKQHKLHGSLVPPVFVVTRTPNGHYQSKTSVGCESINDLIAFQMVHLSDRRQTDSMTADLSERGGTRSKRASCWQSPATTAGVTTVAKAAMLFAFLRAPKCRHVGVLKTALPRGWRAACKNTLLSEWLPGFLRGSARVSMQLEGSFTAAASTLNEKLTTHTSTHKYTPNLGGGRLNKK